MSTNSNQVEVGNLPEGAIVVVQSAGNLLAIKILLNLKQEQYLVVKTVEVRNSGSSVIITSSSLRYLGRGTTLSIGSGSSVIIYDMPYGEETLADAELSGILCPGDEGYWDADSLFDLSGVVRGLPKK